jgi:hypothetical protein
VFWSVFFRTMYRLLRLFDPLIRWVWQQRPVGLGRVADLRVAGRRSGRERATLVTVLDVDGRWYVGHPNGASEWTRNVEGAEIAELRFAEPGSVARVRPIRLYGGPEREAVIRATWSQQPFPANVIYALARRRVRDAGVYFRLNPLPPPPSEPA